MELVLSPLFLVSPGSGRDAYRQMRDAVHEARVQTLRRPDHLDHGEAPQDFLPQQFQLQLGEAVANATMDAEAEGQMLARALAVDDELVGPLDRLLVAIARDVPHCHLLTLADGLAANLR